VLYINEKKTREGPAIESAEPVQKTAKARFKCEVAIIPALRCWKQSAARSRRRSTGEGSNRQCH